MFMRILPGILVVPIIALGILYGGEIGKLNKANDQIASLTTDLTTANNKAASLTTDLTTANNKATSLTADLATASNRVTTLTADLATASNRVTTLTADLATANNRVTTLTADLAAANSRSANFTAELAAVNARVTKLTTDLAIATSNITRLTAELADAKDDVETLSVALLLIGYPRHWYTVQELTAWLAQDDTNTNPAYAVLRPSERAFILMVKALQDGFIIGASVTYSNGVYSRNMAIVGGSIYYINASTDNVTLEGTTTPYSTRPLQPLP